MTAEIDRSKSPERIGMMIAIASRTIVAWAPTITLTLFVVANTSGDAKQNVTKRMTSSAGTAHGPNTAHENGVFTRPSGVSSASTTGASAASKGSGSTNGAVSVLVFTLVPF